jgi:hypothetical protein
MLTATIKSGTTAPGPSPYCYLNSVRYNDVATYTGASAKVTSLKVAATGKRLCYATCAGDMWYKALTSAVVTITVLLQTRERRRTQRRYSVATPQFDCSKMRSVLVNFLVKVCYSR